MYYYYIDIDLNYVKSKKKKRISQERWYIYLTLFDKKACQIEVPNINIKQNQSRISGITCNSFFFTGYIC